MEVVSRACDGMIPLHAEMIFTFPLFFTFDTSFSFLCRCPPPPYTRPSMTQLPGGNRKYL